MKRTTTRTERANLPRVLARWTRLSCSLNGLQPGQRVERLDLVLPSFRLEVATVTWTRILDPSKLNGVVDTRTVSSPLLGYKDRVFHTSQHRVQETVLQEAKELMDRLWRWEKPTYELAEDIPDERALTVCENKETP